MSHIDEGRLEAWLDRDRSGMRKEEAARIGTHLEHCVACASRAAEARQLRERTAAILGARESAVRAPDFADVQRRAGVAAVGRDRGTGSRRRLIALAWAASVIAAVGLGWLTRDLMPPRQMAMERPTSRSMLAAREDRPADNGGGSAAPGVEFADPAARSGSAPGSESDVVVEPEYERGSVEAEVTDASPAAPDGRPGEEVANARVVASRAAPVPSGAALPAENAGTSAEPSEMALARGRVRSTEGLPIQGALVRIGAEASTLTDSAGNFALVFPAGGADRDGRDSLSVQMLGFAPRTVPVPATAADTATLDVVLRPAPDSDVLAGAAAVALGYARAADVAEPGAAQATPGGEALEESRPSAGLSLAPAAPQYGGNLNAPRGEPVSLVEASRRLGAQVVSIPGLEISSIEMISLNGVTGVSISQRLEDGSELILIESIAPSSIDVGQLEGISVVTSRRGSLQLTAIAPIDDETLARMLESAR